MDLRLHAPRPDVVMVRVRGPVDGLAARLLAARVGKQLYRAPFVVLDLGEVSVLGPQGLTVLSTLHQQAMARGTQLHIVGAEHDAVRLPLHVTGLAQLLSLESTAEAVIAVLPGPVMPRVESGRGGPDPDDEDPACGLGQDRARTIGPSAGHCARSRRAHAIPPDPPARQINDREEPVPRHPQTPHAHTSRGMTACFQQWQDAELAMNVARHCLEEWLQASQQDDTPSTANRHAYNTHEALHEAVCAITLLIATFRVEAMTLATTPAGSPVITSCD